MFCLKTTCFPLNFVYLLPSRAKSEWNELLFGKNQETIMNWSLVAYIVIIIPIKPWKNRMLKYSRTTIICCSKNSRQLNNRFLVWGNWPTAFRRYSQIQKVTGSNYARCSAGLRDPISLRGSRHLWFEVFKIQRLTSSE